MAFPDDRYNTFTGLSTIPSAFLNALQDEVIKNHKARSPLLRRLFEPGSQAGYRLRTLSDGLVVVPKAGMTVTVKAGSVLWDTLADIVGGTLAADTDVVVNAAHATLERWDVISATVDGNYNIVLAYTAGTPNASPWLGEPGNGGPALPAAHQKIARIKVPALDAAISQDQVIDFRRPVGFTRVAVPLSTMFSPGANWPQTTMRVRTAGAAGQDLYAPLWPIGSVGDPGNASAHTRSLKRLARLRLTAQLAAAVTVRIHATSLADFVDGTGDILNIVDVSAQVPAATPACHSITIAESGNTLGALWLSGGKHPYEKSNDPHLYLRILSAALGDAVKGIVAEYWG